MSDLRDRITKAIADAQFAFDQGDPYNGPEDADVLADAVIRELTDAIPPIVATAIQGWVLSECAAISHHGEAGEYEMLKQLDREALQIARYATTHKDWNG